MEFHNLKYEDIKELEHLHNLYFENEFAFPDFLHGYINAFIIRGEDNKIIIGGGVRPIMEAVLITDLNKTPRERREALLLALQASILSCQKLNHNSLHCFVSDSLWERHLEKYHFEPIRGNGLVLKF